jgi:hypothetical protein
MKPPDFNPDLPRPPMVHELKCWPEPFEAVAQGRKPYEVRKFDRDFRVGDALMLQRWDPKTKEYSGTAALVPITYMTPGGEWGLPEDICVLGLGFRAFVSRDNGPRGQLWSGTGMARAGSSE